MIEKTILENQLQAISLQEMKNRGEGNYLLAELIIKANF